MKSQGNKYDGQLGFVDKQRSELLPGHSEGSNRGAARGLPTVLDILMARIEMIAACVLAAKFGTMIICLPSLVALWGHSRQQGTQPEH